MFMLTERNKRHSRPTCFAIMCQISSNKCLCNIFILTTHVQQRRQCQSSQSSKWKSPLLWGKGRVHSHWVGDQKRISKLLLKAQSFYLLINLKIEGDVVHRCCSLVNGVSHRERWGTGARSASASPSCTGACTGWWC